MSRRYDAQYIVEPASGCWLWQWAKSPKGYGKMRHEGRTRLAHIVYYERVHGPVPAGRELDHTCEVRACVNPAHLEPVAHVVNLQRGRMARLTPADVVAIRAEFAQGGATKRAIAQAYGVSAQCVSNVVRHRTWRTHEPVNQAVLDRLERRAP